MQRIVGLLVAVAMVGCAEEGAEAPPMQAFELSFAAVAGGSVVGCTDSITGLGPEGQHTAGLSDLRFYVSDIQLLDADGNPVEMVLDASEFQYHGEQGFVGLIDLTGNTEGTCADGAVAQAEGTARTNAAITGLTFPDRVASVSFRIGVPQAVMKETIATNSAEAAPSPLNEMYWSWASGYRHFVLNMAVETGGGETGDAYIHVGSRDCGPQDGKALEDREACGVVNTAAVTFADFDLAADAVHIDIPAIVEGLSFETMQMNHETGEVLGPFPGVACHSSPMQPHCESIFSRFGLDVTTGAANAVDNSVFLKGSR